jgi:hypothetical protein
MSTLNTGAYNIILCQTNYMLMKSVFLFFSIIVKYSCDLGKTTLNFEFLNDICYIKRSGDSNQG